MDDIESELVARLRSETRLVLSAPTDSGKSTQDLASFWNDHSPRLKSELQRKHPKHHWRLAPPGPFPLPRKGFA